MNNTDNKKLLSLKEILACELVSLICLFIETISLAAFYMSKISFAIFMFIHISLLIILILFNIYLYIKKFDIKLFTFITVEVAVAGPMGCLISVIALFFYYYFMTIKREKNNPAYEVINPTYEITNPQKVYNQVVYHQNHLLVSIDTEPMRDIINYGTTPEKLAVLIKINKYFNPEFSSILFEAVNDSDNSVRVQAAAIIANIEKKLLDKLKKFEINIGEEEVSFPGLEKFLNFEEKYSKTGLLHTDRYKSMLENWVERCRKKCIRDDINSVEVRLIIGRLYMLMNRPCDAFFVMKKCLETNKILPPNFIKTYMKTLFLLEKYELLREFSKEHILDLQESEDYTNENINDIIKIWSKS